MKRRLMAAACALAAACAGAQAQTTPLATTATRPVCAVTGEDSAAIAAIDERFELRLDDDRLVRLAALAPAPPDVVASAAAQATRESLAAQWLGRPVIVQALGPPDRWGRVPAMLAPVEGGDDLATRFLAAGAAVLGDLRETGGGPDCPAARLAAERSAREAGVGLWSDAYYAVHRAEDRDGLLARAGTFALVEGTVRRVGTGRLRLYLDFGGRDGFSVTATTRTIRAFEAAGVDVRGLAGRRLRVRGILEIWNGRDGDAPRMEIASPGALETLDEAGR